MKRDETAARDEHEEEQQHFELCMHAQQQIPVTFIDLRESLLDTANL